MGAGRDAGKGIGNKGKGKGGPWHEDWLCGECGFSNFGRRLRCRECGCFPSSGARKAKAGGGKGGGGGRGGGGGGGGGDAGAWGVGGIAQRQLRQQAEAEKIGKLRAEHKREVDRLQRQLDAAKKGSPAPIEVDMDDDGDGDEAEEEDKEQKLQSELRQIESLAKNLDDSSSFKEVAKKKADELRKVIEDIKERKGGPEARVLGMAGRHAKALRIARAKLVKKTRAHARAEEEAEALEKEQEDLQEKIRNKRKEVDEIKEDMQAAQTELEKLAKSEDLGEAANGEGEDAGQPLGPQARAQILAQQLLAFVPGSYKEQLQELVRQAMEENMQRASNEWCFGKGS